jgi:hypothetical protein
VFKESRVARRKEVSNGRYKPDGNGCRATKEISSHRGPIRRYSEGIIQYDIDNLGRHLISVQWDNGVIDYVYPLEIEVLGQGDEPAFEVLN